MREVTEQDFRKEEYRDAKVEEYEFREDGVLVRKDRWFRAVQSIKSIVGIHRRDYEIEDIISAVEVLVDNDWVYLGDTADEYPVESNRKLKVKLEDGSILAEVEFLSIPGSKLWKWRGMPIVDVIAWREY